MSDKVFLDIVNMSITGSFAILIIILARLLLKKGLFFKLCVKSKIRYKKAT